jgi:uncharacterized protein YlxW (UPF0749 family)
MAVLLFLGILVSLQIKSFNRQSILADFENQDLLLLQDEVMALIRENSTLIEDNQHLSDYVNSLSDELAGGDTLLQQIIDDKNNAESFAGLTEVSGNGISILIDFGPDVPVKSGTILLIINELRASGALAISVQSERIVAMTEIRDVGSANPQIIINGNPYSAVSAFSIKAIFRADEVNRGMQLINALIEQMDIYGQVTINSSDTIIIPKLTEDSLTYRKLNY